MHIYTVYIYGLDSMYVQKLNISIFKLEYNRIILFSVVIEIFCEIIGQFIYTVYTYTVYTVYICTE